MDRHIVPGIEAQHAAEAHREDLKIQDQYGCKCMTYWVDEERGFAFCLIDAPDEESVRQMHDRAHGLIPHDIIQVNPRLVESFLGRMSDPEQHTDPGGPITAISESAFRTILMIHIKLLNLAKFRRSDYIAYLKLIREKWGAKLEAWEGRNVEYPGKDFIASFTSMGNAVRCASDLQKEISTPNETFGAVIGVHAGLPVTEKAGLYGEALKIAGHLCFIGEKDQVMLSSSIAEAYPKELPEQREEVFERLNPAEEKFLVLLMDTLSSQWNDAGFRVEDFCEQMSMSKSNLYRKCLNLTGRPSNELLREYRLQRSLDLLKTERNVSQTAFDCGFTSPSYFTRSFQQRFGVKPTVYISELND